MYQDVNCIARTLEQTPEALSVGCVRATDTLALYFMGLSR